MATLFSPFVSKDLHVKNRIVLPPMCQYEVHKEDGIPTDWHFVHYVSRAVGGFGLIILEMTAVEPDGRITNRDLGLWSDEHIPAYKRMVDKLHEYGAKAAIQLGHAGRKATDAAIPVAPSAIPFDQASKVPHALTTEEIEQQIDYFQQAALRAVQAGFDTIEIHGAHGYLLHQFHSPLTNQREDEYGRDLTRFGVKVVEAVKKVIPESMPLIMRVSAQEYVEGGYDVSYAIDICRDYKEAGIDIFHITSGGEGPIGSGGRPGAEAGYQVPLAEAVREALAVPVIAVGKLENPADAARVVESKQADLVAIGRGALRNPFWPLHVAQAGGNEDVIPAAYRRAF